MAKKKENADTAKPAARKTAKKAAKTTKPRAATKAAQGVPNPADQVVASTNLTSTTLTGGGTTISAEQIQHQTVTRDEIAQRAYELYIARGRLDGYAEQDWHQAQRELMELAKGRKSR